MTNHNLQLISQRDKIPNIQNLLELSPLSFVLLHQSLSQVYVHLLTPILKELSLDPSSFTSYCPVFYYSLETFLGKVVSSSCLLSPLNSARTPELLLSRPPRCSR